MKEKELKKKNDLSRGYIYWNTGKKMLVRLAVSIFTLRLVYKGPVTVICDEESYQDCLEIAREYHASVKKVELGKWEKNSAYLSKCLLAEVTPYDTTIFLDSDTIVYKDISELFDLAEKHEYVATQFVDWRSTDKKIAKRIKNWESIFPDLMEGALKDQPAINGGVFAFSRDSSLMRDWFSFAVKGMHTFIPDETSCQVILHKYPHFIVSPEFNMSCKFGEILNTTKVVHFHGRKQRRLRENGKPIYNAQLWYGALLNILDKPFVIRNIQHDRQLRHYINHEGNKWILQLLPQ